MPFFPSSHHTQLTDQPHLPDLDPLCSPLIRLEVRRYRHGELADCRDFAVVGPSILLARQQFDENMG